MQINALKSQKTNGRLGYLHINNRENKKRTKVNTLYLISYHFQESDWGLTRLEKQSKYNKSNFSSLAGLQDLRN